MNQRFDIAAKPPPAAADVSDLAEAILDRLRYGVGTERENAQPHDWFLATALALRDRIVDRWIDTNRRMQGRKRVYYLSIEYLIGRMLFDALSNMEIVAPARSALELLGVDLDDIRKLEPDPAIGSGGLGRLAACYMESMASLNIAACGYGIRYTHGLFRQKLRNGWQHEVPEDWLASRNPWELERSSATFQIRFGGAVEYFGGDENTARAHWYPAEIVNAVAFDMPAVGWRGRHVNTLRLWSARPAETVTTFEPHQDYSGAVAARERAEAISGVLYPSTDNATGEETRLRQEFFFTSASLQDIVQRHLVDHVTISSLPDKAAIQINDTHPALAVAELMRILVDDHGIAWSSAWQMTTAMLNYTNHTLLPEALKSWPVGLMSRLLPRHMQIIYLINWLHLKHIGDHGGEPAEQIAALSLIQENGERRVRMGHLAFIGSSKINGVSALHTDLMRKNVFNDLDHIYPGRIVNKTNGIGFRRWLFQANPRLTGLLVATLGSQFLDNTSDIGRLEQLAGDQTLLARLAQARKANKRDLCAVVRDQTGLQLDPAALFDVHIKRIHEYKRQLLNILETVALFHRIREQPDAAWVPRVKIFAGKAAMTYAHAKLIIKLANDIGALINNDPVVGQRLKVVFLPNYNVSLAELIVPAADLSEQISTAGFEASGTGNMKLALNGALTIGTYDGANIEISESVGNDNIFIFGLRAHEVAEKRQAGFAGRDAVGASPLLGHVIDSIAGGQFSPDEKDRFRPIVDRINGADEFMVAADFDSYWDMQRSVDRRWQDQDGWWRASLLNTARMAWFSADRAIREYAQDIWHVPAGQQAHEM